MRGWPGGWSPSYPTWPWPNPSIPPASPVWPAGAPPSSPRVPSAPPPSHCWCGADRRRPGATAGRGAVGATIYSPWRNGRSAGAPRWRY